MDSYELSEGLAPGVLKDSQGLVAIPIRSNNFLDALIMDGDIITVRKGIKVEDGDQIIATLRDGERERTVIRVYECDGELVTLKAVNEAVPPILARLCDLTVTGKVISVIRHY